MLTGEATIQHASTDVATMPLIGELWMTIDHPENGVASSMIPATRTIKMRIRLQPKDQVVKYSVKMTHLKTTNWSGVLDEYPHK